MKKLIGAIVYLLENVVIHFQLLPNEPIYKIPLYVFSIKTNKQRAAIPVLALNLKYFCHNLLPDSLIHKIKVFLISINKTRVKIVYAFLNCSFPIVCSF